MSNYILGESEQETQRLRAQAARDSVVQRVLAAGLRPGMHVVDAGCGPGEIARTFASLVGPTGSVRAFDLSDARIGAARQAPVPPDAAALSFQTGDVYAPPVAPRSADFVFSQYVFEYLHEPERAARALAALLRPGGKLLVCDGDGIGVSAWPLPPLVEAGLPRLVEALGRTGFDPFIGRKLFAVLRAAGLEQVRVSLYPFELVPGPSAPEDVEAWRNRFQAFAPLVTEAMGGEKAYAAFVSEYLHMLSDPGVFKFGAAFAVEGTAPWSTQ